MNSKDNKGMCASVENGLYGDVDFELLNFDLPDTLEGDGCIGDWSMNLGPIPADIFAEVPAVSRVGDKIGNGNGNYGGGGGSMDFLSVDVKESFKSQLKQHPSTFFDERKMCRIPKSFEAPSPDSVLERRISTSTGKTKTIPLGPEITIPVKARTNRSRPSSTSNSWSKSLLLVPLEKEKKKRRVVSQLPDNENKKCTHCEITKTPQWREGPMGPKTLCNACGVRYRSGRLFPEYRPAASPTFIPSLHSNSHRKVIEMRQKGVGFVKKPTAAITYPAGAGNGVFVKQPAITTILNSAGAGNGVFVKKPTTTAIPYPAGSVDGVFVKKPRTTAIPYPVGAGDGVFVKKPTTAIPFPAGAGYGVFVNKPMGSIPTLTRLGSDY